MTTARLRPAFVEAMGTGLLLFVIVGSGITAEGATGGSGIELLVHATAVGAGLAALIAVLARLSGAHLNPAVTLGFWRRRAIDTPTAIRYSIAQAGGATVGVVGANLVMAESLVAVAPATTITGGAVAGELIGTFFLVLVILGLVDQDRRGLIPAAAGAWVAAMILATPSGGLLNPAVTLARTLTDTFTGMAVRPAVVFAAVQLVAGVLAAFVSRQLVPLPELKGT